MYSIGSWSHIIVDIRFWYFMHQMRKMKKTTGEILDVNEVISIIEISYQKISTLE